MIDHPLFRSLLLFLLLARAEAVEDTAYFEKHIRPLLIQRCLECHSEEKQKGGLRLDFRQGWQTGGESGPAIKPGEPDASLLIRAVRYRDPDLQMPPKSKLPAGEIALLEEWVRLGAPDPREGALPAKAAETAAPKAEEPLWSFQPRTDPLPPEVHAKAWPTQPLDRFVLANLEAKSLSPAPPANRRQLLRRVFYDLTGLPPTPDDLAAFLADDSPTAYERVLDRLLASPRHGERWGRHWLDVARYSDSNGMDENMTYAYAHRYRDYVVDAFNADLPFDVFIREQLAGDLMPAPDPAEDLRLKAATGFLAVGPKMLACDDPEKMRRDIVDEQLDTTGRAFLGMTFGCARCHDHKFDPISAADYYALGGIFMSTKTMVNYKVVAKWHEFDLSPPEHRANHQRREELAKKLKDKPNEKAKPALEKELAELRKQAPPPLKVMGVTENEIADMAIHLRGNYLTLGEVTPRRFPVALVSPRQPTIPAKESGRRELANWIADPAHPLTARVAANRGWRWHFGQGIVPTADNFGRLGMRPSNPSLLEHMAQRLVDLGWSWKRLHREIMTSSTYRQSAAWNATNAEADPENTALWRWNRQRLDAESLRDALLFLADRLDLTMGGQLLPDEPGTYVNRGRLDKFPEIPRRSLYLPMIRSAVYTSFVTFDFADPSVSTGERGTSVVAPQALYLMNSPEIHTAAKGIAERLASIVGNEAKHRALFRWIFLRGPTASEWEQHREFLGAAPTTQQWAALCRVLLATNEFLHVE